MNDRRAVFLDRDGVLIEDVGYLSGPEQMEVLPGVAEALKALRRAGFLLIVATNQSAIARGWLTERELRRIHRRLQQKLRRQGVELDGIYWCPHLPNGSVEAYARECDCRKPRPGLLEVAAREHGINLASSYMVGDSPRDAEAGKRAGCYAILVGEEPCACADGLAEDLKGAAALILRREAEASGGRRAPAT